MQRSMLLVLLILALAHPGPGAELKAGLANPTAEPLEGPVDFPTGQVELTFPDGRTRLLSFRSRFQPLVADGLVYILPTKDGKLTEIVVYNAADGRVRSFAPPGDLDPYFGNPSFSPDGTRVAYYQLSQKVQGRARVRSWPDWQLLWESPLYPTTATDVPPAQPVWKDKNTAQFDPQFFDPPRPLMFQAQAK